MYHSPLKNSLILEDGTRFLGGINQEIYINCNPITL